MSSQAPSSIPVPVTPPAANPTYAEAFIATSADRAALELSELSVVFADVEAAASRAHSAAQLAAKYDASLATLPVPADLRQNVLRYAQAALGAQLAVSLEDAKPPIVVPMIDELRAKRDILLGDVKALIGRGLLAPDRLDGVTNTMAYRSIAFDVITLCTAITRDWSKVQGRTGGTLEEYEAIAKQAHLAHNAVGLRELQEKERSEAAEQRQRAFTLLVRAYDELRRALTFILWNASEAEIAQAMPPLQPGRPRRQKEEEAAAPTTPGASPSPAAPGAPATPTSPTPPVAPGLPGSSPFIQS